MALESHAAGWALSSHLTDIVGLHGQLQHLQRQLRSDEASPYRRPRPGTRAPNRRVTLNLRCLVNNLTAYLDFHIDQETPDHICVWLDAQPRCFGRANHAIGVPGYAVFDQAFAD